MARSPLYHASDVTSVACAVQAEATSTLTGEVATMTNDVEAHAAKTVAGCVACMTATPADMVLDCVLVYGTLVTGKTVDEVAWAASTTDACFLLCIEGHPEGEIASDAEDHLGPKIVP